MCKNGQFRKKSWGDAHGIFTLKDFVSKFKRSDFIPVYGAITTTWEFLKSSVKDKYTDRTLNFIRAMIVLSYNNLVLSGVTIVSGLLYNNLLKN